MIEKEIFTSRHSKTNENKLIIQRIESFNALMGPSGLTLDSTYGEITRLICQQDPRPVGFRGLTEKEVLSWVTKTVGTQRRHNNCGVFEVRQTDLEYELRYLR